MSISESMVNYYLDILTVGYFNDNDLPPDDVRDYEPLVCTIKAKAFRHGDMEHLYFALAWLLTNKDVNLEAFNGGRYPFDAKEMRDIINLIYSRLFADRKMPPDHVLREVRLVNVPLDAWWQQGF
ncbi:hypothetical protein [Dyadobacter jiangsuensis]|uniref:Uncharacterized protein n=1 Tax=Dyadobacter jiangsuensis TaxID=1591085 RepID=A0A2P8GC70_9BACT|nr:hypothetical protein [Dyadobacter jiangsuensis]PSL31568.1 hypothetical protein CLV60_103434 [Dyadobacter jiangsuensis]